MPHIHGLQKDEAAASSQRGGGNGCHGGFINLYYKNVVPKPYRQSYHKSYYIIVWVFGIQNLSGAEVWAAAFRGREEEREGEGGGGED